MKRFYVRLRRLHIFHTWRKIERFSADHVTMSGILWGWTHRYQRCRYCECCRLIEGFASDGYFLREGFTSED